MCTEEGKVVGEDLNGANAYLVSEVAKCGTAGLSSHPAFSHMLTKCSFGWWLFNAQQS